VLVENTKQLQGMLRVVFNIQMSALVFILDTRVRECALSSGASCTKQIQLSSFRGAFRREGGKL
jgi:hypothetical protein